MLISVLGIFVGDSVGTSFMPHIITVNTGEVLLIGRGKIILAMFHGPFLFPWLLTFVLCICSDTWF